MIGGMSQVNQWRVMLAATWTIALAPFVYWAQAPTDAMRATIVMLAWLVLPAAISRLRRMQKSAHILARE